MKFPTIYDELFEARDEAERLAISNRMTMEERFFAGYELFKREVERMKTNMRKRFPWMNELEVERAVRHQLDMLREPKEHTP